MQAQQYIKHLDNVVLTFVFVIFIGFANTFKSNVGGTGLEMPLNVGVWFGTSIFVFAFLSALFMHGKISFPFSLIGILVSCCGLILPLLYNDLSVSFLTLNRFYGLLGGILFLFCITQISSEKTKHRLLYVLFFSCLTQGIYGMAQMHSWLPQNTFPYVNMTTTSAHSVFQHRNAFSSFMALGIGVSFYLYSIRRSKTMVSTVPWLLAAAVLVYTMADSNSRVGLSSLVLCLTILMVAKRKWVSQNKLITFLFVSSVFLGLFANKLFFTETTESIKTNFVAQTFNKNANTFGTRETIYPVVFSMIKDSPMTGVGYGAFARQYIEAQAHYIKENPDAQLENILEHPHNEILTWVVEGGVVPAISILFMIFSYFYFMWKSKNRDKILVVIGLTSPLTFHAMVEIPFSVSAIHWLALLLILGIFMDTKGKTFTISKKVAVFPIVILFVIASQTTPLLINAWQNISHLVTYKLYGGVENLQKVPYGLAFRKKFEYAIMNEKISHELSSGEIRISTLQEYIDWAEKDLMYNPTPPVFAKYIECLALIGNKKKAYKQLDHAKFLYPRLTLFPKLEEFLNQQSS